MSKKLFSFGLIFTIILGAFLVFPFSAKAACSDFDPNQTYPHDQLEAFLSECNAEAAQTQAELTAQKNKSSSIASDVALLNSLIAKAKQQITIKNQIIAALGTQITEKQATIQTLTDKLNAENESLAQILRQKNEVDTMTLTEMLLSDENISDFFLDEDNLDTINKSLQESLNVVEGTKQETASEKADLQAQQVQQADLLNQIVVQKNQTQEQQTIQAQLLASSKQQEQTYASLLAQKQAQAAKISAALFHLAGGSKAIPFGDAYKYAQVASSITGVRPAFILAILKQESNLGSDQGGCYVTNLSTGAGTRASDGEVIANVMKSPRDTTPYETILSALGLTVANTQVSCPEKVGGSYMGYGGAMGPTQFIPSTWILFSSRIEKALNESASNPWDPQDAIMATALYMEDLGATSPSKERTAACEYYSGHGCTGYASSYGNSVINLESSIQSDINVIDAANQ